MEAELLIAEAVPGPPSGLLQDDFRADCSWKVVCYKWMDNGLEKGYADYYWASYEYRDYYVKRKGCSLRDVIKATDSFMEIVKVKDKNGKDKLVRKYTDRAWGGLTGVLLLEHQSKKARLPYPITRDGVFFEVDGKQPESAY